MNKKIKLVAILALFAFVTVNAQKKGYNIGDAASDFKLKNIDGKMVSMTDYKNAKGFIVVFTSNHCPFAVAYEDRIIALHNKYAKLGYPVIAINPNDPVAQPQDSYELMQKRAKEKSLPYVYLFDDGQKVHPLYGATKTPEVYLLNKENSKLVVRYHGTIDDNYKEANKVSVRYVADAIDALIANKPITTTTTVAIGCTIKYKK